MKKITLLTLLFVLVISAVVCGVIWKKRATKIKTSFSQYSEPAIARGVIGSFEEKGGPLGIDLEYKDIRVKLPEDKSLRQYSGEEVFFDKLSIQTSAFRDGVRLLLPNNINVGEYGYSFAKRPTITAKVSKPTYLLILSNDIKKRDFFKVLALVLEFLKKGFSIDFSMDDGEALFDNEVVSSWDDFSGKVFFKNDEDGKDKLGFKFKTTGNKTEEHYYEFLEEKVVENDGSIVFSDEEEEKVENLFDYLKNETSRNLFSEIDFDLLMDFENPLKGGEFSLDYEVGSDETVFSLRASGSWGIFKQKIEVVVEIENYRNMLEYSFDVYNLTSKVDLSKLLAGYYKGFGIYNKSFDNVVKKFGTFALKPLSNSKYDLIDNFIQKFSASDSDEDFKLTINILGPNNIQINGKKYQEYETDFLDFIEQF